MKTLLAFALVVLSTAGFAQIASTNLPPVYQPTALVYTNGFADNATNANATGAINCTRDARILWSIKYQLTGSGTAVNWFDFESSLDNTNWPGTYFSSIGLAANGTNVVLTNFVMDVEPHGYIRLARGRFGNNSGSTTTNLLLNFSPKPYIR